MRDKEAQHRNLFFPMNEHVQCAALGHGALDRDVQEPNNSARMFLGVRQRRNRTLLYDTEICLAARLQLLPRLLSGRPPTLPLPLSACVCERRSNLGTALKASKCDSAEPGLSCGMACRIFLELELEAHGAARWTQDVRGDLFRCEGCHSEPIHPCQCHPRHNFPTRLS